MADGEGVGRDAIPVGHEARPGRRPGATETMRRERHRAEEALAAEERKARLVDHSFCEICGHRFYDPRLADIQSTRWSASSMNNDPLQREEDYLVHFMAEHMLDELDAGRIDDEDVQRLAEYLEVSKRDRRKLVLGLSEKDAAQDPLIRLSFLHHSRLRRIDNCFALFFTLVVAWIVYQARFGAEPNPWVRMARKASTSVMSTLGQIGRGIQATTVTVESTDSDGQGAGAGGEL